MSGCTELIEGESVTFDASFYPTAAQQVTMKSLVDCMEAVWRC
jgi:hypothetical protein